MKIAIISDTHDNIWKLAEVLERLKDADVLIFCGDFCAPFTLAQIAEGFSGPVHVVFGNNDGDPLLLAQVAVKAGNVTLHGFFAYLELGGRKVAVVHYPPLARDLAASGRHDLVCHGHDHRANVEQMGHTLLVDPGEVMGRFGRSTYAVYDTEAHTVTLYEV
ncbi:MAG: metallophosphatase family protein [Anaerolineae bacterium]|jgi:putative phosphoesterase|nr:metallophosphatase family protein [Anaerolineae bacterium]MDH7474011.1 metallophosphoesterase family protein [Anaerolineae bacterium]